MIAREGELKNGYEDSDTRNANRTNARMQTAGYSCRSELGNSAAFVEQLPCGKTLTVVLGQARPFPSISGSCHSQLQLSSIT